MFYCECLLLFELNMTKKHPFNVLFEYNVARRPDFDCIEFPLMDSVGIVQVGSSRRRPRLEQKMYDSICNCITFYKNKCHGSVTLLVDVAPRLG